MGGEKLEVGSLVAIGEPLRESASALVDGETGEFEIRRLLEQSTPELRALLSRHYTVRTVLRHEADLLCPPALTASILNAIEREPLSSRGAVPGWQRWAGGAAVAASVCLVAVLGTRTVLQQQQAVSSQVATRAPIVFDAQHGPIGRGTVVSDTGGRVGLTEGIVEDPDGAARERLQMFMMEHAANSALNTPEGMMPYARVVSYEEP